MSDIPWKAVCPRGYNAARATYKSFPTVAAMKYARQVCAGEAYDHHGIKKKSPQSRNYILPYVSNVNGFTRRHAEQWVNVCTGVQCPYGKTHRNCRPSNRIDSDTIYTVRQMTEDQIDELCRGYHASYPDADGVQHKLLSHGLVPATQVLLNGEVVGITDTLGQFHIAKPSPLLKGLELVELT